MYSNAYSQKQGKARKPIRRADGKVIGNIIGDTLVKKVSGSKHMLRNPKGWAVDKSSVLQAKQSGATKIEIRDRETGILYRSSMECFIRYGIDFDRGFGSQIALPLERWTVINPTNTPDRQLGFFDNGGIQ